MGEQGLEGTGEARTWLLPMLRQHVTAASLGFWGTTLLPLARDMGSRAATASSLQALQCRALEAQLWAAFPAFCSWPLDLHEAFRQDFGTCLQFWDLPVLSCG